MKLTVELIPTTSFGQNIRNCLPKLVWDLIRKDSYTKANNRCEICNSIGKSQGYKHNVECHEIWEFDDINKVQKLKGFISLCPRCHQIKHIGRAMAMGKQALVFKHFVKVNNCSFSELLSHLKVSYLLHRERSLHQWKMDFSLIREYVSISDKELAKAENKVIKIKYGYRTRKRFGKRKYRKI